jgi:hypothetical protein
MSAPLPPVKTPNPVRRFILQLAERAVKTAAYTAMSLTTADGINLWSIHWHEALGVVGGATIYSVLGSLSSTAVGDPSSPSLVS